MTRCLGAIDGLEQGRIDDLRYLGDFGLDGLRWEFDVSTADEEAAHVHLVLDVDVEVLIGLDDPLRSGGAEELSTTICTRARGLDDGDWVGGFQWYAPIGNFFVSGIRIE